MVENSQEVAEVGQGNKTSPQTSIVIVSILLTLGFFVAGGIFSLGLSLSCEGNGGLPYAARASTYGQVCEGRGLGLWQLTVLFIPAMAIIFGGVRAWKQSSLRPVGLAAIVSVAVLAVSLITAITLPDQCSDAQEAAGEDCAHY